MVISNHGIMSLFFLGLFWFSVPPGGCGLDAFSTRRSESATFRRLEALRLGPVGNLTYREKRGGGLYYLDFGTIAIVQTNASFTKAVPRVHVLGTDPLCTGNQAPMQKTRFSTSTSRQVNGLEP